MMDLRIVSDDPLFVLSGAKIILREPRFVSINKEEISRIILPIKEVMATRNFDNAPGNIGITGNWLEDIQLAFLKDTVNFCFWGEANRPRWNVEWPSGNFIPGGAYAMKACFERAMVEGIPILDAFFLASLSMTEIKNIFRSSNKFEVPLLEERRQCLREAGKILLKKYDGLFFRVVCRADYDAVALANILSCDFSSFADFAIFSGKKIAFLKRAQLCSRDISSVFEHYFFPPLKKMDLLTAFSDYKLPQILRAYNIIEYVDELQCLVDYQEDIPAGSVQELEIRAATIWAVELIRQKLGNVNAAKIDQALWLMSQEKINMSPYHRTRTIYY